MIISKKIEFENKSILMEEYEKSKDYQFIRKKLGLSGVSIYKCELRSHQVILVCEHVRRWV